MTPVGAPGTRRPLRVCMVHYSDYRTDSRIQRLAGALAERGDEVHAVGVGASGRTIRGHGSVEIHALAPDRRRGSARALLHGYAGFTAAAMRCVATLHARRRLDLVEAHNMPDALVAAALVPRLAGVPLILNVHDTLPELFETRFGVRGGGLLRLEERLSAAAADAVITVTEEAKAVLAARGVGVNRTVVVMNSPDERVFGPPRPPVSVPDAGEVRAIYHGGLPERFGVEVLIRAVGALGERVPRLRLSVLGSGDERDALASLAAGVAPGRVSVAPRPVAFTDIPAQLEAAHIGVVPTLSDAFTNLLLPVKLLEYVHMGLPVASSRLAGIERYFTGEELRYADPGSPASLADALAELCADPQAAAARAARAAERMRTLRWDEQRRGYLATVDDLVARRVARTSRRWRTAWPPLELRTPVPRR
ncbi:glycosyltransferase family 4 protein [Capillimicrobium parvum]|uniref:Glycosyltransferase subfamily 4-like N-terminal domain-containing protein n=1 Tax=Capillimicrobium parvum TaxID=2884022 RepID=A0A9E6Y0M3_9ACTN|nr:glycosyltransferase family 4 protein [Capillimicrobium parvum]UGS37765.1 hypothetical protein DSM104329_04186 [Capillimicrobium parvum]